MSAQSNSEVATLYQLVKIPLSLGVSIDVHASSIDEVRRFAMENVDTTTRWIIKLNGRNLGEAIQVARYRFDVERQRAVSRIFDSSARRIGFFDTPEAAEADYRSRRAEANQRLDAMVDRLNALKSELGCDIGYTMDGDTHGIHDHYLYVSVEIGGYEYQRQL